jgi:hypothetical protein
MPLSKIEFLHDPAFRCPGLQAGFLALEAEEKILTAESCLC